MEKTISFFNELGVAVSSAIIVWVIYSIRWFLLKIKHLFIQDHWKKIEEKIESHIKPITDLAIENQQKLEDMKNFQNDIYQKFREVKHEIKNNTESSINHQVLDSLNNLQDYINKLDKNDK